MFLQSCNPYLVVQQKAEQITRLTLRTAALSESMVPLRVSLSLSNAALSPSNWEITAASIFWNSTWLRRRISSSSCCIDSPWSTWQINTLSGYFIQSKSKRSAVLEGTMLMIHGSVLEEIKPASFWITIPDHYAIWYNEYKWKKSLLWEIVFILQGSSNHIVCLS